MEENRKTLKLSYVPEHDGARGEWMEEQMSKNSEPQNTTHGVVEEMDLRDYFATEAMRELISRWDRDEILHETTIAENAYRMADTMLRQRDR